MSGGLNEGLGEETNCVCAGEGSDDEGGCGDVEGIDYAPFSILSLFEGGRGCAASLFVLLRGHESTRTRLLAHSVLIFENQNMAIF